LAVIVTGGMTSVVEFQAIGFQKGICSVTTTIEVKSGTVFSDVFHLLL
jgi:hypothetical protein